MLIMLNFMIFTFLFYLDKRAAMNNVYCFLNDIPSLPEFQTEISTENVDIPKVESLGLLIK